MNIGLRLSGTHSVLPIFYFTIFWPSFLSSKSTKNESVFEKVSKFGIFYNLKESKIVYLRETPFWKAWRATSSISSLGS